ncbi:hypothetical protein OIU76_026856 [Salix suchowensis]|nr:hypothetical protein OIU76_026856 [Salix suchowensis]
MSIDGGDEHLGFDSSLLASVCVQNSAQNRGPRNMGLWAFKLKEKWTININLIVKSQRAHRYYGNISCSFIAGNATSSRTIPAPEESLSRSNWLGAIYSPLFKATRKL